MKVGGGGGLVGGLVGAVGSAAGGILSRVGLAGGAGVSPQVQVQAVAAAARAEAEARAKSEREGRAEAALATGSIPAGRLRDAAMQEALSRREGNEARERAEVQAARMAGGSSGMLGFEPVDPEEAMRAEAEQMSKATGGAIGLAEAEDTARKMKQWEAAEKSARGQPVREWTGASC
jgi:hypothetical protein